jgi:hypothetical protein
MTQQHPITPPPELLEQWAHFPADWNTVAPLIAQWGADQELEACCAFLEKEYPFYIETKGECRLASKDLCAARRPKPPSLKEQALAALNEIEDRHAGPTIQEELIRRALEQLPDDK